jgi:hypothetical protein
MLPLFFITKHRLVHAFSPAPSSSYKVLPFDARGGFSKGEAQGTQVFLDIFFAFSQRAGNQNRGATQACSFGFYS